MSNIRILTLNIRRGKGDDGINNWEYRKNLVRSILEEQKPHIAVFQEVLYHQLEDLKSMLPRYRFSGVGRDDGLRAGEFSPIFFKGLSANEEGTFWMSDTPDTPSCTWPGMTRICSWVTFGGDKPFAVFNTHLEYEFESTQLKSVRLIKERLGEYHDDFPVLLTGDFNLVPRSGPYAELETFMNDSYRDSPDRLNATYHGWSGQNPQTPDHSVRIDYIWNRGNLKVENCRIHTDYPSAPEGVYPSDHWPVVCDFQIT